MLEKEGQAGARTCPQECEQASSSSDRLLPGTASSSGGEGGILPRPRPEQGQGGALVTCAAGPASAGAQPAGHPAAPAGAVRTARPPFCGPHASRRPAHARRQTAVPSSSAMRAAHRALRARGAVRRPRAARRPASCAPAATFLHPSIYRPTSRQSDGRRQQGRRRPDLAKLGRRCCCTSWPRHPRGPNMRRAASGL